MKKLLSILLFALPCLLKGSTYFVSNTGSNTNSGLSVSESFLTIQYASDQVIAGDTVIVLEGAYVGFDHRDVSGTFTDPIVFRTQGQVLINQAGPIRDDGINIENADYIIIDGFTVNGMIGSGNGIRLVLSDFCVVRNCSCDSNAERGIFTGFTDDITIEYNVSTNALDEHGIYVSNSSDRPVIRYNTCYGNNSIGIHMNGDLSAGEDGIIHDAKVYGNVLFDNNRAAGINMDGCMNPKVFNNLIYNNHFAQGIALFQGDGAIPTQGAEIYNNTILVPSDGRWGILVNEGSNVGTKIYNNIILNEHEFRGSITIEDTTGFRSNYNIVNDKMSASGDGSSVPLSSWKALDLGLNSQLANAPVDIFVNPSASDYELLSGSQAIEMGTNLVGLVLTDDIIGMSRPQNSDYDIGCYEKIYCPKVRRIINTDLPLSGYYFAQDSLILDIPIDLNSMSEVSLNAPNILNNGTLNLTAQSKLQIDFDGCQH